MYFEKYKINSLRCVRGYRTISASVVNILVGIPPLEVKFSEIAESYKETKAIRTLRGRRQAKNCARQNAMKKWKNMLDKTSKRDGTRKLIYDLEDWMNQQHEQLTF